MTRPLNAPQAAPARTPAHIAGTTGRPALTAIADTTPDSASTEPTERSIPPVMMTMVSPIPSSPMTDVCNSTVSPLLTDRNAGLAIAKQMITCATPSRSKLSSADFPDPSPNISAMQIALRAYISVGLGIARAAGARLVRRHPAPGLDHHVVQAFGPERLMWGSHRPKLELAGTYADWLQVAQTLCAALSDADRAQVFGQTAIRFYDLNVKEQRP